MRPCTSAPRPSARRVEGHSLLRQASFAGDFADAARWAVSLAPLARAIAARNSNFLPRQTYPIRTGVHPNTAFGIAFALDYADAVGDRSLRDMLVERSLTYYASDKNCPGEWEPGGEDFFSPCLMEADLMRRVLAPGEFAAWCMAGIASALPADDPARERLARAARDHAEDALAHVASGRYEGEHWLASFAVYMLSSFDE